MALVSCTGIQSLKPLRELHRIVSTIIKDASVCHVSGFWLVPVLLFLGT